jgi:hypothetical protein
LTTSNQIHRKSGQLRSASSFPVGAANGKFGGTELLREPNSLRSSAFKPALRDFFSDFVPQRASIDGRFLFLACIQAKSLPKKMIAVSTVKRSLVARDLMGDRSRHSILGKAFGKLYTRMRNSLWFDDDLQ